nr:MAG TPA: hypothetical protein [Caudoviricetes sp.]
MYGGSPEPSLDHVLLLCFVVSFTCLSVSRIKVKKLSYVKFEHYA